MGENKSLGIVTGNPQGPETRMRFLTAVASVIHGDMLANVDHSAITEGITSSDPLVTRQLVHRNTNVSVTSILSEAGSDEAHIDRLRRHVIAGTLSQFYKGEPVTVNIMKKLPLDTDARNIAVALAVSIHNSIRPRDIDPVTGKIPKPEVNVGEKLSQRLEAMLKQTRKTQFTAPDLIDALLKNPALLNPEVWKSPSGLSGGSSSRFGQWPKRRYR